MELTILLPVFLWLILAVFFTFRSGYSLGFRILALLVLLSFVLLWWSEIITAFKSFGTLKPETLVLTLQQVIHSALMAMLWVWPLALVFLLVSNDNRGGGLVLVILTVFTALLWVSYLYFGFHYAG